MKMLKWLPTLTVKVLVRFLYSCICLLFPVRRNKISFASYRSDKLSGNLYYVHRALVQQQGDYEIHFLFKKFHPSIIGKVLYIFHIIRVTYHLATSAYVFIDDFYFPLYLIKKRKETTVVQLWHAGGAFKKFGYSTLGKPFGPSKEYIKRVNIHSNYSYAIVSSSEVIPHFAEAFNMPPKQILPLGIPRTDYLLDEKNERKTKEKLYRLYPHLKEKKIILYAPTFRGKSHKKSKLDIMIDFEQLREALHHEYVFVIKLHPYMDQSVEILDNTFFYQLDPEFHTEEILLISDLLITDYSSIIFDYSLLGRPIAFFARDLKEYIEERDFYYPYEEFVPGPIFSQTEELVEWLKRGEFETDQVKQFAEKFFNYRDGKASQRIIETIILSKEQTG